MNKSSTSKIIAVNRVFLATVIISVIGGVLNAYIFRATQNLAYIMIISQIIIALPSLIYLKLKNINIVNAIRLKKINLGNIVLIILFTYLITPFMGLINLLSTRVVSNSTEQIMGQITSENSFLISLLLVAFVPCVLEETVYRGIFYNEYRKVNVVKGIILSGFLFGIIHGNFNQFSYAFAMGIIFALLIEATDSILSTMIVHFFINGTSVFAMYLLPKLNQIMEAFYGEEYVETAANVTTNNVISPGAIAGYAVYAAFTSILGFIVFRTIAKRTGKWEYIKSIFKKTKESPEVIQDSAYVNGAISDYNENNDYHIGHEEQSGNKLITGSLIMAITICIILMLLNEEPFLSLLRQLQI